MDSFVSPVNYVRRGMSIKRADGNEADGFRWHKYCITKVAKRSKTFVECHAMDDDHVACNFRLRNVDFTTSVQPEMIGWKFDTTPMNVLINELWEERKKTKDLLALLRSYSENNVEHIEYDSHRTCKKRRVPCHVDYNSDDNTDETSDEEDNEEEVVSSTCTNCSPVPHTEADVNVELPQCNAPPTCKSGWRILVHFGLIVYMLLLMYAILFA